MAVAPYRDRYFQAARPSLSLHAGHSGLIDLDGTFGLHPAFSSLVSLFRDGRLAIVHGVGSPNPTRSHFDAQDYMETGTPGIKSTASGWLNRAIGLMGHEATPFQAVALTRVLPQSLYGEESALAIADLNAFALRIPGGPRLQRETKESVEALYDETTQPLLRQTSQLDAQTLRLLSGIRKHETGAATKALYPNSPLGKSLRQIARLIRADVGLEVAFAESGGWDTHVRQGTTEGTFARRARDLGTAISAFWSDLGPYRDDVVLMTMTEFGRTVRENGSAGTDHGRASCLFVLGNAVDGGRVHGDVPILEREALTDGRDLPVTTDFRSVFAGVAGSHLGLRDDASLFPGWNGERFPLVHP